MKLSVDVGQRYAKMRAHTATHLLHAELAQIFPQTKQAGSLVDEDYLRFDFYADDTLTDEQLEDIEQNINQTITHALLVETQEMSYDNALQQGAKAFFEDKYDDTVRVVMIGKGDKQRALSVELCGGTHVSNTSHIGAFTIISQESIAAGTKRITAVTGPKISEELRKRSQEIISIATSLGVQENQVLSKITSLSKEIEANQRDLIEKNQEILERVQKEKELIFEVYLNEAIKVPDNINFKTALLFIKKDIDNNKTTVIFNEKGNYAIISPIKKQALEAVEKLGLKKGRKDEAFCQGNDASLLEILKAKIDKSYQLTGEETNQSIQIKSEYTGQQSNSEDLSER